LEKRGERREGREERGWREGEGYRIGEREGRG
jgi:hypothetical protein